MTASRPSPAALISTLPWVSWALLLAAGYAVLHPVTPTWMSNSNYAFGWWIPVVSLFLFHERWAGRPARQPANAGRFIPLVVIGGVLFFAFRIASEADPDWRPALWVMMVLYAAALLGWLWLYGGWAWLRYFAFPVGFLFLSLPWFFQIEYPLTQGLMRWNAWLAAHTLQGAGIEATPAGNIIRLANCDLGVEEACSGILSLQASLMMGCLLGEIYRLPVRRRFILVGASLLLALTGNYFRTLTLSLIAFYKGPEAVSQWHDTAGYSILVFTGLGTWLASLWLGRGVAAAPVPAPVPAAAAMTASEGTRQWKLAQALAIGVFLAAAVAETATQAWYAWNEARVEHHPDWAVQWPAPGTYKEPPMTKTTREALRCDLWKSGQWRDDRGWDWNVFWIQYDPKPYTRVVLGWHTPDNCLPSAGLVKDQNYPDFIAEANGIRFLVHPKKFLYNGNPLFVFWVVYPNSGELPPETDTRLQVPLIEKLKLHFADLLAGNRGVGVETLEVSLRGPHGYDEAKAAYLLRLDSLVKPGSFRTALAAEASH